MDLLITHPGIQGNSLVCLLFFFLMGWGFYVQCGVFVCLLLFFIKFLYFGGLKRKLLLPIVILAKENAVSLRSSWSSGHPLCSNRNLLYLEEICASRG